MENIPCYKCLIFIICKQKVTNSVCDFVDIYGCPDAKEFTHNADQNDINKLREIFGLEGYKLK